MKIKAYIYAEYNSHSKSFNFQPWGHKCLDNTFGKFIGETEVEFPDVDPVELLKGQVVLMRAEQQKIRAEAEVKYQNIETQIQQMLCIEHKEQP